MKMFSGYHRNLKISYLCYRTEDNRYNPFTTIYSRYSSTMRTNYNYFDDIIDL